MDPGAWSTRTHTEAQNSGARIVHCCGFDSIPSDLGVWMLQQEACDRLGQPCDRVDFYVKRISGGFSGGTMASMSKLMEEASNDPRVRRILANPYSLNPPDRRTGPTQPSITPAPSFDERAQSWIAPFLMASINTRVVHRTNALLGERGYGQDFLYREVTQTGRGPTGALKAGALYTQAAARSAGLMSMAPTRNLLTEYVLPSSGEGPSQESIDRGHFTIELLGSYPANKVALRGMVSADSDPGYGATSMMLAESAMCLALDDLDSKSGVLTPASAMAAPLIERLRAAGMTFEVTAV